MIGPGNLPKAVPVYSALAMVPTIMQNATSMTTVVGKERNDSSDSFLIQSAVRSLLLGYMLKSWRRLCPSDVFSHNVDFIASIKLLKKSPLLRMHVHY